MSYVRHLLIIPALLWPLHSMAADIPGTNRQAELQHLLKHDCGSCHGMTMTGGLGPALTARALRGKSESYLRRVIRDGRPGTPMPPWRGVLSEGDIAWLVKYMLFCGNTTKATAKGVNCRPQQGAGNAH